VKDCDVGRETNDVWTASRGVCLAGRRILVVEDEVLVATTIECEMQFAGAEVVGPAYTLDEALELAVETIDVAVLDINLNGAKVWPVARKLRERGVPYVFASANAFGPDAVPSDFAAAPRFDKPVRMNAMLRTLAELTQQAA
jgi:CheY-like chemotaxis protein